MTKIQLIQSFVMLLITINQALANPSEHPRDQWLTAAQINADIDLAEVTYQRVHPGYTRYTTAKTMTDAWQQIRTQANQQSGMRLADFYLHVSEVLALVRCDHSKAELPKALAEARESTAVYLPFQWQFIDNQVLVEQATTSSGLVRGDQVISIDGVSINERLQQVKKYVPVDGFTDHTKMNLIAASSEHKGGALDHFGAMLWPTDTQVLINYIDLTGNNKQKSMQRINYSQWKKLSPSNARNFIDAVEFTQLNQNTAYLKVDTFVNYRKPIKPDKLFDPIFKKLKKQQTKNLILDLRENGGGSNEPPQRLLAHLMSTQFRQAKEVRVKTLNLDDIKQHVFTWEKSALNPKASQFNQNDDGSYSFKPKVLNDTQWTQPDKTAFKGRLIVLTSRNNSSGSTILLSVLKSRPNTTFIGEPTGGSVEGPTAGVLLFLKLPASGITTRVPMFRYFNDVEQFEPGMGIKPDALVSTTKHDFINGVDSALQAAIKMTQ
jgi:hypothetical protein